MNTNTQHTNTEANQYPYCDISRLLNPLSLPPIPKTVIKTLDDLVMMLNRS